MRLRQRSQAGPLAVAAVGLGAFVLVVVTAWLVAALFGTSC